MWADLWNGLDVLGWSMCVGVCRRDDTMWQFMRGTSYGSQELWSVQPRLPEYRDVWRRQL